MCPLRVLGIDPGSIVTGFAILDTGDCNTSRQNANRGVSESSPAVISRLSPSPRQNPGANNRLAYVNGGAIRTGAPQPLPLRLKKIFDSIQRIIAEYSPDSIAIEEVFLAKNPQSVFKLSHVRGVVMLASALAGLDIYEYSPRSVKQAVVGYGQASKLQVQKMVQVILGLDKIPAQDASDALAVAICHIHSSNRLI